MRLDNGKLKRTFITLDQLREQVGASPSVSEWLQIDQALIDGFAQVTSDPGSFPAQPRDTSVTASQATQAQHFLILSLITQLMKTATRPVHGMRSGANYGFDRVRFIASVPANGRIRIHAALVEIRESKPGFYRFSYDLTVEIANGCRPALVARWIVGRWADGG